MQNGSFAGYGTLDTVTPREFFYSAHPSPVEYKPGGIVIDKTLSLDGYYYAAGNSYDLRAGWWMGRNSTTGKYTPCKRTRVNMTGATATAIVVDNSYAFKVGDVITIGGDTGLTISAIDYTTHTLTITSTTVADNDVVFCEDGSGIPRGILGNFVRLRNSQNTAAEDKFAKLVIQGSVNQAYLLGDTDAIVAFLLATPASNFIHGIHVFSNDVAVL